MDQLNDLQFKAELYQELYDSLRQDDAEHFRILVNNIQKEHGEDFLNSFSLPGKPTLLQCACNLQVTKAVEALMEARVNPNTISKNSATPPLILAVEKGNVTILRLLTRHKQIELDIMDDPRSRQSVLHRLIAIMGGYCTTEEKSRYQQCFELLLETTSINTNLRNGVGRTPLHQAASFGLGEVFIKLLQQGADPNIKDSAGQTALYILIEKPLREVSNGEKRKRLMKCVWFLFDKCDHSFDVNAQDENGRTVLHLAANCGLKEVCFLLMENGANPNLKDDTGKVALHVIVNSLDLRMPSDIEKYLDCMDVLLQSNSGQDQEPVDVEIKCSIGFNALDYAIVSGVGEAVSKLLKNGANPNVKDDTGQAALHHVIWQLGQSRTTEELKGYEECLDALLDLNKSILTEKLDQISSKSKHQIDVNSQDNEGDTALHLATQSGLEVAMKKLRSMMNDLRIENKRGWTVLHEIVHPKAFKSCNHLKKNRSKYFEILVGGAGSPNNKLPIDVNARDKDGNTLLYYAIVSKFEEVVVRLMLGGARMSPNFCRMIPPSVWETFMDSCICVPDNEEISSMNFPITFDYSRLLAPLDHDQLKMPYVNNSRNSNSSHIGSSSSTVAVSFQTGDSDENIHPLETLTAQSSRIEEKRKDLVYPECETLWHLSRSTKHQTLMKHPLITSILLQKWHRVRWIYYIRILLYAIFLGVLTTFFIQTNFSFPVDKKLNDQTLKAFRCFLLVMSSTYLTWSIFQLCMAPCVFLMKKESWMDLLVQGFALFYVVYGTDNPNRDLCAVFVFLAWTEGLILLSQHPKLSMYVTMFTTVSLTFLRLLFWYSLLLFAFALSFLFIFSSAPDAKFVKSPAFFCNKTDHFDNIPDSVMKVMVMMTGEIDFGNLPFTSDTSRMMFVAFLFLISIVLYSLLNAMAVSDIRDIHDKAETIFFVNLVESFAIQESIMLGDPCNILPGWTLRLCSNRSILLNPVHITKFSCRRLLLFTSCPPDKKTSTFDPQCQLWQLGTNPFLKILRVWKKFFYDSNYQLSAEIIQIAQHKVLENRQRSSMIEQKNCTDIVAEMQTLKEDIQAILRLLKPSTSGPVSKELSGLNIRVKQKPSWTPKAEGKQKSLRRRENSEGKCV